MVESKAFCFIPISTRLSLREVENFFKKTKTIKMRFQQSPTIARNQIYLSSGYPERIITQKIVYWCQYNDFQLSLGLIEYSKF